MDRKDIIHSMFYLLYPFERSCVSYSPVKLRHWAWHTAVVSPLKVPLRALLAPQTFSEILQRHLKRQWMYGELTWYWMSQFAAGNNIVRFAKCHLYSDTLFLGYFIHILLWCTVWAKCLGSACIWEFYLPCIVYTLLEPSQGIRSHSM